MFIAWAIAYNGFHGNGSRRAYFTHPEIFISGHNMIKFNFDTSQPGRFSVSRFCLHYSRRNHENDSSSRVEFVSDILSPTVHLEILNNPPVITMGKVQNGEFSYTRFALIVIFRANVIKIRSSYLDNVSSNITIGAKGVYIL